MRGNFSFPNTLRSALYLKIQVKKSNFNFFSKEATFL